MLGMIETLKCPPEKENISRDTHSHQPLKTGHKEQFLPLPQIQTASTGTQEKENWIIISLQSCTDQIYGTEKLQSGPFLALSTLGCATVAFFFLFFPLTTHSWNNFSSLWLHRLYTAPVKCNLIYFAEGQAPAHVPYLPGKQPGWREGAQGKWEMEMQIPPQGNSLGQFHTWFVKSEFSSDKPAPKGKRKLTRCLGLGTRIKRNEMSWFRTGK